MFMPKEPVSVTLDRDNLMWLRGRAARTKRRSLSDTLDEIVTAARLGGTASGAIRSVVGTVDIAADDPALERADQYIREQVEASLSRPLTVHEERAPYGKRKKPQRG
jgi:hypothetical protein